MVRSQTFPFKYGLFRPVLSVLGAGPAFSRMELDGGFLRVRMGPMFRAEVPLASITAVEPYKGFVGGIGVHGGRGFWLVNGAASGLVTIDIDPPVRAQVLGVPVRLMKLRVSTTSPEDLIAALRR